MTPSLKLPTLALLPPVLFQKKKQNQRKSPTLLFSKKEAKNDGGNPHKKL